MNNNEVPMPEMPERCTHPDHWSNIIFFNCCWHCGLGMANAEFGKEYPDSRVNNPEENNEHIEESEEADKSFPHEEPAVV